MENIKENLKNYRYYAPQPWYLEQCNEHGVVVNDNHGSIIFAEFFDDNCPDTMKNRAKLFAHFLLSLNEL